MRHQTDAAFYRESSASALTWNVSWPRFAIVEVGITVAAATGWVASRGIQARRKGEIMPFFLAISH